MSIGPFSNPTPSPEGSTSLSPSTQSFGAGATSTGGAPPQFTALVRAKLQQMIGARYYLVDASQINALADKLWQNVGMQQLWGVYTQSPQTYAATLQAQVEATVLNTSGDPSVDPTILTDYIDLKQSAGQSLSTAELAALAQSTQASNAVVPKPFGTNFVSGYDFGTPMPAGGWIGTGESFGWDKHYGVDYGTRAGDRIVSPFAGTVTAQTNIAGYGNLVTVTLDNGWKISFGHVASASAQNGTRVNPGDLIAIAGANVGSAQGPVTIVTWQDPQGRYVNPHDVLDPIFGGTTFSSLGAQGAAGTGMPTVNKVLDTEYPSIKSDWTQYYGSPPSPEDVYNVLSHGTSPEQWRDYIRSLPSHIEGMTTGQAYDLRSIADSQSMKALGHLSTDRVVKDLHDQRMVSEGAVKLWYDEHSPNEIDKDTYQQIYKQAQPIMQGVFNEQGVDPRVVKDIHSSQQANPDVGFTQ